MGIVQALVALVGLYVIERAASRWRKVKLESRRAKAEYPITGNDPTGNLIA